MDKRDIKESMNLMELTEDILRTAYENMLDDISSFYRELYKAFTADVELPESNPEYLL